MKKFIIFCFFIPVLGFTQPPQAAVSNIQHLGLYRGLDNQLAFYLDEPGIDFYVVSDHAHVSLDTASGFYIVKAGAGSVANFYFINSNTQDTIDSKPLTVKNIPPPNLYLGALENKSSVSAESGLIQVQTRLFAKYPPEVPLVASFSVISYSMFLSRQQIVLHGQGSNLSRETIEVLQQVQNGDQIEISAVVLGADGKKRKVTSVIFVK